jgi:hypothetical protein
MAEEKIFLDETLPVVTYTAAPFSVLGLFRSSRRIDRRRGVPHTANVRVLVTDKRIVVDKKTFILANVATVTEHDDEAEVAAFNKEHYVPPQAPNMGAAAIPLVMVFSGVTEALYHICKHGLHYYFEYYFEINPQNWTSGATFMLAGSALGWLHGVYLRKSMIQLTPDYAVVIESAGTRDNALVSKDRMVVQRIVRAISDALVAR